MITKQDLIKELDFLLKDFGQETTEEQNRHLVGRIYDYCEEEKLELKSIKYLFRFILENADRYRHINVSTIISAHKALRQPTYGLQPFGGAG